MSKLEYHRLDTLSHYMHYTYFNIYVYTAILLSTFVLSEREIKVSNKITIMLHKKQMCVEILVIGRIVTWVE